jgi:hypothetical protein
MSWHGIRYSLRLLNEKAHSGGRGSHQCCVRIQTLASGPMRMISPYRSGRSPDWLKMVCITAANMARLSAAHAVMARKSVFMACALMKSRKGRRKLSTSRG